MAGFEQKYQQWLQQFSRELDKTRQQQVGQLVTLVETIRAYLAGRLRFNRV